MAKSYLLKSLSEIAARELKVTRGVNPQWQEKADLAIIAYGQNQIEQDFISWIESVRDSRPSNPVTDYLKVMDDRLGNAPTTEENDPRVSELIAMAYKDSDRPASKSDIQKLLDFFSLEEIKKAWKDYIGKLDDKELKYAVENFFRDGGAQGIILAQRQTEQEDIERTRNAEHSTEEGKATAAVEVDRWKNEKSEHDEIARRIAENPSELFGG